MDTKLLISLAIVFGAFSLLIYGLNTDDTTTVAGHNITQPKQFSSQAELETFLKDSQNQYSSGNYSYGFGGTRIYKGIQSLSPMLAKASFAEDSTSSRHSTTNNQVEGVDEADYIKNDGKYIYMLSGNSLVIMDAYPPQGAKIASVTNLTGNPQKIFVNKDKLVVFGSYYEEHPAEQENSAKISMSSIDMQGQ